MTTPDDAREREQSLALAQIDRVCRLVNRELWIVTAAAGEQRGGLVATWVSQASIDPKRPVLMVGIAANHFTAELIDSSRALSVHLITAVQVSIAWNFAIGSGRQRDKLAGIAYETSSVGSPRLIDCLAWLDCRVFARFATGDRIYYWADIIAAGQLQTGQPLREHELMAAATDEQRRQLLASRDMDIGVQQPMYEAWRQSLPEWLK